jgi:hypothetical protein
MSRCCNCGIPHRVPLIQRPAFVFDETPSISSEWTRPLTQISVRKIREKGFPCPTDSKPANVLFSSRSKAKPSNSLVDETNAEDFYELDVECELCDHKAELDHGTGGDAFRW